MSDRYNSSSCCIKDREIQIQKSNEDRQEHEKKKGRQEQKQNRRKEACAANQWWNTIIAIHLSSLPAPCPSDDFLVTVMSVFTAGGPRPSAVIFVLVAKYSPHQKENHGGISLCCINIYYPPPDPFTVITVALRETER